MNKNNTPGEIFKKIKSSKKFLLSLHNGPDGDSLASCAAMKYFLERDFNKEVKLISPDNFSGALNLFDFVKEVEFGKKMNDFDLNKFDVILFLDFGSLDMGPGNLNFPKGKVISIDHHNTNTYFGDFNYIDTKRPSACSVLIDLFKKWGVKFDKELSTRLLLGVYTDSLGFSKDETSLRDAVFLIDNGAEYAKTIGTIKNDVSLKIKKYFSILVSKLRIEEFKSFSIGVSSVSQDDIAGLDLNLSDVRSGINYLQEISGMDFLFTLVEMDDMIKGSFRSTKNIDVSLFAEELAGGGHKLAAAFRLPKMPLKEAEKKVFDAIKKIGIHTFEEIEQ